MTEIRTIGLETFLPCTTLLRVLTDMKYSNDNRVFSWRLNYIKLFCLKSILLGLVLSCTNSDRAYAFEDLKVATEDTLRKIIVGAERTGEYLDLIKDKRVGIVGNQSSMIRNTHVVDSLLALGVNIQKVFSPEHGFRGKADAGEHVKSQKDEKTGLPIVSLYGSNKKPSNDQVKDIDVMIFDIQDVGVRFYTYISTLHYVMESCAENGISLIILDRPNPNGHYVDGPVLDKNYKSFIGMHEVPIVHGMTIGEYGKMINGEGWLDGELTCDLNVISCENYDHDKPYSLPVAPSPNLRSDLAIQLYPSLCLLEATTVSIGRGTDHPFEQYGHPDFPETGYSFTPQSGPGSKNPKLKSVTCNGYFLDDSIYYRMNSLDLSFVINSYQLLTDKKSEFLLRPKSFNLLAGNSDLIKQLGFGLTEEEIKKTWESELSAYKEMRKKYLLYP